MMQMQKADQNRISAGKGIPFCAIILFFLAYLSFIKSRDIWTDEAYMMQMLRETSTLKDAVLYAASDTHPPAYFVLLKLVTIIFGQNLFAAKLLSVFSVTGSMILGTVFLNRYKGYKASLLYVVMLGAIPCSMQFSVEIRMYALALFFLTGCGVCAFTFVITEKKRFLVICTLFGGLASYTHYFSLAATALIFGILLILLLIYSKKNVLYWSMAVLGCIVLYLPWMPYFYVQFTRVSGGFWIPEITWHTLKEYTDWYFGCSTPYAEYIFGFIFIVFIGFLVKACLQSRNKATYFALGCFLVWLLTILVGIFVSAVIRPIFLIKYSYPMVGMLCLSFAWFMEKLKERLWLILVCLLLCFGIVDYQNTYSIEYESTMTEKTLDFFENQVTDQDVIAYNYNAFGFIYDFYFPKGRLTRLEDVDFSKDYGDGCIYLMHTTWNPLPSAEVLEQYGWKQEYMGLYGIEHNEFKIFRYSKK